jgi:two-component system sensor histidine kinase KdpD
MRRAQLAIGRPLIRAVCRQLFPTLMAVALVAAMTVALEALADVMDVRRISVVYLIPVLIAATQWGVVPAVCAAISGVAISAFLYYPPIYSFQVTDPQQVVDLSLFIFVAVITGQLANNVKRQVEIARQRENETRDLYAFSRRLATAVTTDDIFSVIRDHLIAIIPRRVALFGTADQPNVADAAIPALVKQVADRLISNHADLARESIIDDGSGNLWLVRPVSSKTMAFGVVAIDLGSNSRDTAGEIRARVDAILTEATDTLERLDMAQAISAAKTRSETELLREALIGSVSHELRTPLASILGAASALGQSQTVTADRRLNELISVVRSEAERLNNDIQNLLDATRISSAGVRPRQGWVDPADIINAAVGRRQQRLAGHKVVLDVDSDLPLVYVDSTLLEQAFGQILDNAAKYSPPGSTIVIKATGGPATVKMSVTDQGLGLAGEEQTRLWERFFRGDRHLGTISGSGLGLWIANAFVAANGGRMEALSQGAGQGATVSIILPAPQNTSGESVPSDE